MQLKRLIERCAQNPANPESLQTLEALVAFARILPFKVDLWNPQNIYYELLGGLSAKPHSQATNGWLDRFRGLGGSLGIAVPQQFPRTAVPTPRRQNRPHRQLVNHKSEKQLETL